MQFSVQKYYIILMFNKLGRKKVELLIILGKQQ